MKTEKEIRERVAALEEQLKDPDTGVVNDDAYLDDEQQSELYTLLWVLGEMDDW